MGANSLSILEGSNMTVLNSTGATIPQSRLVKISAVGASNNPAVALAAAGDAAIGVTKSDILDGKTGLIRLLNAPGTHIVMASATEAIAAGNKIYQAASGKTTKAATTGNRHLGEALSAAAVDTDLYTMVVTPSDGIVP